jgi:signal transduction histidine kinase
MANLTAHADARRADSRRATASRGGTRLHGRWLLLARAGWIAAAVVSLGLFVAGVAPRLEELERRFERLVGFSAWHSTAGEIVLSPWPGGPAARAGILERDVLVAVDGEPLSGPAGLVAAEALARGTVGAPVTVSVRTGQRPLRHHVLTRGGEEALPLAGLGLSQAFVAAYATVVAAAAAVVLAAIAGLLFWRRADDWLAMLVSATMLAFVGGAAPVLALYRSQPSWQMPFDAVFALALGCLLVFFLLFPDGRFVPGWTRAVAPAAALWMVAGPLYPPLYPWRMSPWPGLLVMLGCLATGVAAQVYRYRRVASAVQRQQTKWVVFGAGMAAVGLAGQLAIEIVGDQGSALALLRDELVVRPISLALIAMLPVSVAVALLRYRLWDVDVLISRTLLYGLLTGCVVGTYALAVGGLGALLRVEGSPAVSLLAAGVVAVLFQPLRERLQRGVNRLLFGERDDPYAVLSRLGRRLGATLAPEAVLPAVVSTVREALKLPYAAVALRREDGPSVAASAGEPVPDPLRLPLLHRGEPVGELWVGPRGPGEGWSPADRRLLEDVAGQAGAAVHAVRLTADLQRLTADLQAARERLVLAREEERRRLRRDLHDDLAPTLAALGLTAATARQLLQADPTAAANLLAELHAGLRATVGDVRRLAYELRPPTLDELGLVAAVRERAAQHDGRGAGPGAAEPGQLRVVVEAPESLPNLPAAVEVAAYRIVQEALTNVVRHAGARSCCVRLGLDDALLVEVIDDGAGLSPGRRAGVGIVAMRERAAELGGSCRIEALARGGTRVVARLPLAGAAPAAGR